MQTIHCKLWKCILNNDGLLGYVVEVRNLLHDPPLHVCYILVFVLHAFFMYQEFFALVLPPLSTFGNNP